MRCTLFVGPIQGRKINLSTAIRKSFMAFKYQEPWQNKLNMTKKTETLYGKIPSSWR